jgi:tetratricopeptide (TPR) repeat protein
VSNIFPQDNIFAERYLYTPSVGFCLGIGFLFWRLLESHPKWQKSIYALFIILILILGIGTFQRNKAWKNELVLWQDTVKKSPQSKMAHSTLAATYDSLNRLEEAEREAKIAISIDPNFDHAVYILGDIYIKKGLLGKAAEEFNKLTTLRKDNTFAYDYLAAIYGMQGEYEKAKQAATQALEKNPGLDNARHNLAISYQKLGLMDEAIQTYEEYLKNNPKDLAVHMEVGQLYYDKQEFPKAENHWRSVLANSPGYKPAQEALKLLEDRNL